MDGHVQSNEDDRGEYGHTECVAAAGKCLEKVRKCVEIGKKQWNGANERNHKKRSVIFKQTLQEEEEEREMGNWLQLVEI